MSNSGSALVWKRAKSFAEEAAKKSQTVTTSAKISDLVSETAKRSREFAAEASKKADKLKLAAFKQADQIKVLSVSDIIVVNSSASVSGSAEASPEELQRFGFSDDLRAFVRGLTSYTFKHFPIQYEAEEVSEGALTSSTTTSNVRKDLTEWQEHHATLVLTTVEVSFRLLSPIIGNTKLYLHH